MANKYAGNKMDPVNAPKPTGDPKATVKTGDDLRIGHGSK